MFNPAGLISITLGSVVLDRPDQTGRFIAKDLAGGWAYSIADTAGDARARGHGVCDGGLDLTLRCGLLSALNRAPESTAIRIVVDSREAHRMLVRLASQDTKVVGAIAGRVVSVMTRPDARSSLQVRTAAERAAAAALRDREHAEWQGEASAPVPPPGDAVPALVAKHDWRARIGSPPTRPVGVIRKDTAPKSTPSAAMGRLVNPLVRAARQGLAVTGMLSARRAPANRAVKAWLQDFNCHIETVRGDLQNSGI